MKINFVRIRWQLISKKERACKILLKLLADGRTKLLRLFHVMRKQNFEQEII